MMKLKPYQKNILSMLVIVAGGFALFYLAFLIVAFVTNAVISVSGMRRSGVVHIIGRGLSMLLILLFSWAVFRSRLNDTIKATFLTMPLMVILIIIGIIFYQQSKWIIAGTGVVTICAVTFYLYKKKLPWQYYFSTFYVAVLSIYVLISGLDL